MNNTALDLRVNLNPRGLEHIEEIYQKLSKGYHFCMDDNRGENNMLFSELRGNIDYFRSLFSMLGYQISDGSQDIYYLKPLTRGIGLNKGLRKMTVFMAVMYDYLADLGKDPISAILESRFDLNDLPHAHVEQYAQLLENVGIDSNQAVHTVVKRLAHYGFLEVKEGQIEFRQSVRRFTAIFKDCKDLDNQFMEDESDE